MVEAIQASHQYGHSRIRCCGAHDDCRNRGGNCTIAICRYVKQRSVSCARSDSLVDSRFSYVGIHRPNLPAFFEHQRKTHNPEWILKYQDMFESAPFIELRKLAVNVLTDPAKKVRLGTRTKDLADIDPVLDFFEDLGFYESGGQISAEVIHHHHFFHWIRAYWEQTEPYVRDWQKKEPARWDHLEELFETLQEIEVELAEKNLVPYTKYLDNQELVEFFDGEIETWQSIQPSPSPPTNPTPD